MKKGTLSLNHITDKVLTDAAPEVVIVRPGYYFQFWAAALESMKQDPPKFESPFSPKDFKIPMVSPISPSQSGHVLNYVRR